MKTIERYVFGAFLTSFLLAFLVLSFVLTIALMVQIVGFILDGVSMSLIGRFALVSFPETLQWTVPLSLLVSSVLVFSRLSADSEVAAMRACGVNLLSVMKWPAMFGLACALVGVWVNNEIVPRGHKVRRGMKSRLTVDTGLDVFKPGEWVEQIPKVRFYFARREGNWLYDVRAQDYSMTNGMTRTITASKAFLSSKGRDILLDLYGATLDPVDARNPAMAHARRCSYELKDALSDSEYKKKAKDLRFFELLDAMRAEEDPKSLSRMRVEFSRRLVFALASLCFVLVGIPLGIRAQRKESSVGMALSLAIALGYYLAAMWTITMQKHYAIRPDLLMWLPVAASLAAAAWFTRRNL